MNYLLKIDDKEICVTKVVLISGNFKINKKRNSYTVDFYARKNSIIIESCEFIIECICGHNFNEGEIKNIQSSCLTNWK